MRPQPAKVSHRVNVFDESSTRAPLDERTRHAVADDHDARHALFTEQGGRGGASGFERVVSCPRRGVVRGRSSPHGCHKPEHLISLLCHDRAVRRARSPSVHEVRAAECARKNRFRRSKPDVQSSTEDERLSHLQCPNGPLLVLSRTGHRGHSGQSGARVPHARHRVLDRFPGLCQGDPPGAERESRGPRFGCASAVRRDDWRRQAAPCVLATAGAPAPSAGAEALTQERRRS